MNIKVKDLINQSNEWDQFMNGFRLFSFTIVKNSSELLLKILLSNGHLLIYE